MRMMMFRAILLLMKQLTISDPESANLCLQDEISRTEESRYDHRLHAVLLVAQKISGRQAAQMLGDTPRSVEYRVNRFAERGFSGLMDDADPIPPGTGYAILGVLRFRDETLVTVVKKGASMLTHSSRWAGAFSTASAIHPNT